MHGVPVRLLKDVHGVGPRGLATRVSPDLAKVLFAQGRAEPREVPEKGPPAPKKSTIVRRIEVPLTDKELKARLKKLSVEVPKDADRPVLLNLLAEAVKKDKPEK